MFNKVVVMVLVVHGQSLGSRPPQVATRGSWQLAAPLQGLGGAVSAALTERCCLSGVPSTCCRNHRDSPAHSESLS